ncbi:MAG TPA: integrase [Candidatus Acidoferrum sp.]|nr:integrase [Candidatus Acidoferrum sp.]
MDPRPLPYQGPIIAAMNWAEFKIYVQNKYRPNTARKIMSYSKRFFPVIESGNLGQINSVASTIRSDVIKSLIVIAKYAGHYEQFKASLKSYGIKNARPDALAAFIRIYNNSNSNLNEWLEKVKSVLTPQENLLLNFLRLTGLRCSEGILSFNLIIELSRNGRLPEYLNGETGILEHFRYKSLFLRGTKNAFISIVPESMVNEIAKSQAVTYAAIIKKLQRQKIPSRISELRDFFGTFMIRHGLVAQEADLLCGRIPPSIFVRHYFSPAIKDLKERTLNALKGLQ